jgi:hypothetical protein
VATDVQTLAHRSGETTEMTLGMSMTGAALPLLQRWHRHHVRLLHQGLADRLTKNLMSVAETQLLLLAAHRLPCTGLQSSLPSTKDPAVRDQEIRMKAENLTVHHARLELGILRRLL